MSWPSSPRPTNSPTATRRKSSSPTPSSPRLIQTTVDRSAALEAEGKWLDAYTNYFYWLQAIDPNNKGYTEHVEEILDRAGIAASFQDSPCESRKERFEGVEKRMLEKTIDVLDLYYVRQHRLRPDGVEGHQTVRSSGAGAGHGRVAKDPNTARDNSLSAPDPAKVTAWSAALAGLRDEVEQASQGFGKDDFLAILDKVLSLNDTHRGIAASSRWSRISPKRPWRCSIPTR